jgi:hypothetical protein
MVTQQIESEESKVNIPVTIPYVLIFLLLTYLCYEAHETFHHLTGAVLCGGFGRMIFTEFDTRPQCLTDGIVTLAGPVLTFAMSWFGAYWLRQHRNMLFAFTLILASFAHSRFLLPLVGGGDEWWLVRTYFDQPNRYFLSGVLFLLGLPPLLYAFRVIANQRRFFVFITFYILPLLLYASLPFIDQWFFNADLNNAGLSLAGIPVIVLVTDLAAIALYVYGGNKVLRPNKRPDISIQQASPS